MFLVTRDMNIIILNRQVQAFMTRKSIVCLSSGLDCSTVRIFGTWVVWETRTQKL